MRGHDNELIDILIMASQDKTTLAKENPHHLNSHDKHDRNLDHSIPLNKYIWSNSSESRELVNKLWNAGFTDLDPKPGAKGRRPFTPIKDQLRVILLNLYKMWHDDPNLCLGVAMSKSSYRSPRVKKGINLSALVIDLINRMHDQGYIKWYKGSESARRRTRIWPSPKLISHFEKAKIMVLDLFIHHGRECIILSQDSKSLDEDKKDSEGIAYDDNDRIIKMREELIAYNALLTRTHIDIGDLAEPRVIHKDGSTLMVDQLNKFVRRIFYRADWNLGGRFHGGWWQRLGSDYRSRIMINGESTVELDYSGMHVSLIYGLNQELPPTDPYTVPLIDETSSPAKQRKWIKSLVLQSLNATSIASTFQAFRSDQETGAPEKKFKNNKLSTLLEAFLDKNPIVKPFIGKDKGVELMALDGRITARVIKHFTSRNIPILTVHDSYIVPQQHSGALRAAMNEAAAEELKGFTIDITQDVIGIDHFNTFKAQEPTNADLHIQLLERLPKIERSKEYKSRYEAFCYWLNLNNSL